MIFNTLFMSSKDEFSNFDKSFEKCSDNYIFLNYIDKIKTKGVDSFLSYLENVVSNFKINLLVIQLCKYDLSLNIHFLNNLQKEFNLKIVFIFTNSQNTFEYIDRYYAQLANLIIIEDTPYIDDFYKMLQISFIKIDYRKFLYNYEHPILLNFNISGIEEKTIFISSLSKLTKNVHKDYYYNKYKPLKYSLFTKKYLKQCQINLIQSKVNDCFFFLTKNCIEEKEIFIDDKFRDLQQLYLFYWSIYSYLNHRNLKVLLNFVSVDCLKNLSKIYKIYRFMKSVEDLEKLIPYDVLNNLFYKRYKL